MLLEAEQLFGKALPKFFLSQRDDQLTVYPADGRERRLIDLRRENGLSFVAASRLAEAFAFHTYFNEEKKKLVIYLPHNKIVMTADNPFVIVDNRALQMPVNTYWRNGEIWLPLLYWVRLVNQFTNLRLDYEAGRETLRISEKGYNVAGIDLSVKHNGMVIRIRTSRRFAEGEMSLDMRYDWLHVDLYGATADSAILDNTEPQGYVRKIKTYPFARLLSIAFQLKGEPLSKEIYQDPNSNEVVVVLRYQDEIASEDAAEAQEGPEVQDDVQQQLAEERKRWLIDTVVIDAGHGGKDPGAIGAGRIQEKDVALAVALKLGALVEKRLPDVKVVLTRKDDQFVELRTRTQTANENNAKVFISIHCNSNRKKDASGFETYILGPEKGELAREVAQKENAVIQFEPPGSQKHYEGINRILVGMAHTAFMKQSQHLASAIQDQMSRRLRSLNLKDRGVKQAHFWVMVGASMPSVLVEIGFVTNSYDARVLKTAVYQQKIAEGIFEGLQSFKKDYESAI